MSNQSMELPFIKMQGSGNDFIIIDNRVGLLSNDEIIALAPDFCDRRFGVGGDGIITLQQAEIESVDYTMFYRNADGSDAGMCGNGARCLALYASSLGLGEELTFNVHDNIYQADVEPNKNQVTVSFPMDVKVEKVSLQNEPSLLQIHAGTEHIVKQVPKEQLEDYDFLLSEGKKLRHHDRFNPPGTNVNFICGNSKHALYLQTYERGVEDLTLACGTGAIASALASHHWQEAEPADQSIQVKTKGGNLEVCFNFDSESTTYTNITLKGEAQFVFEGTYKY